MESPSVEQHVQQLLESGLSALESGDYPRALECWNEVLTHDPDNVRAARLVSDLNTVLARARSRTAHRSTGVNLAAVPDAGPGRRYSTETTAVAWAGASTVEQESLQRLKELLGTSEREHERSRNELAGARLENQQLRNELAQREQELALEREQQQQSRAEVSELREQLIVAQASRTTLEAQLAAIRDEHQADAREHIATLVQANEEMTRTLEKSAALQRSLDELRHSSLAEQQRLLEQLAEQNRQVHAHADEREAAQLLHQELATEIQELNAELESMRRLQVELSRENEEKSRLYEESRAVVTQLREHYEQLNEEYAQLEAAFHGVDNVRRSLEAAAGSGEVARSMASDQLAALQAEYDVLQRRAASIESILDATRLERDDALQLYRDAEAQIRTLRSKAVALESEVRVLQEASREVRSLRTLRTELDTQLAHASVKLTTLEREIEDARATAVHVAVNEGAVEPTSSGVVEARQRRTLTRTPASAIAVHDTQTHGLSHVTMLAPPHGGAASFLLDNGDATPAAATASQSEPTGMAYTESGAHWAELSPATASNTPSAAVESVDQETSGASESGFLSASQRVARVSATIVGRYSPSGTASGVSATMPGDSFLDAQGLDDLNDLLGALEQAAELDLPLASPPDRAPSFILEPAHPDDQPDHHRYNRPEALPISPSSALEPLVPATSEPQPASGLDEPRVLSLTIDDPYSAFPDGDSVSLTPDAMGAGGYDYRQRQHQDELTNDDVVARAQRPPLQAHKPGYTAASAPLRIHDFLERAPRLAPNARHQPGAREAFVLGNIDGHTSFADILDVCGLPPADTGRILQTLFEQGVIDFDTDP